MQNYKIQVTARSHHTKHTNGYNNQKLDKRDLPKNYQTAIMKVSDQSSRASYKPFNFFQVTAVVLAATATAQDKKVPPRTPEQRLNRLVQFSHEWLDDNVPDLASLQR